MSKVRICNSCKREVLRSELDNNYSICPYCGYYMRFHARKRILSLEDPNTFREWDVNLKWSNPMNDVKYEEKLITETSKHNLNDAIITGEVNISGTHTAIGVMDTRFMMASMGKVVGEKVTRLFERATRKKIPVILFCCSGGARMQEGIIALMQMGKTAAAVKKHSDAKLLYISVLTNPTMGGVTASFALIADVILAEKSSKVGFAGTRVIQQNIGSKLPERFQKVEKQVDNGMIDIIVDRKKIRNYLSTLLRYHITNSPSISHKCKKRKIVRKIRKVENEFTWEKVKIARSNNRPSSKDFIERLFKNVIWVKGDRINGDDNTIMAGIAQFHNTAITIIGQQKGKKSLEEAIYYNWGMASPSGYRKALRVMKQAEKFNRPIICFIDTIGAACDNKAEENGQSIAIANLLKEMSVIQVPILSIIIGEGNSGGSLALSIANEVWMLENAVYSILSPEAYASILWKDNRRAEEAANLMKITANYMKKTGIVDKIIPEDEPVTYNNIENICNELDYEIVQFLNKYRKKTKKKIVNERYERFRKY